MVLSQKGIEVVYNPSTLLNIFDSSRQNDIIGKVFKVRGIYAPGDGVSDKGVYLDKLVDEVSDTSISLAVPGIMSAYLQSNEVIECDGYLTKEVSVKGKTDLQLNVVKLSGKDFSGDINGQLQAFEIVRKKVEAGYKNVAGFIQSKVANSEPITVCLLTGKGDLVGSDVRQPLQEAGNFFKLHFIRTNLPSEKEIIESLNYYQKKCDILAIACTGGRNPEILDNLEIARKSLSLSSYFVVTGGVEENVPLLKKVADKSFATPIALSEYFNKIYRDTAADLEKTKAVLVDDITRQLDAKYAEQIGSLTKHILAIEQAGESEKTTLEQQLEVAKEERNASLAQIQDLQIAVKKAKKISVVTILLIIIALLVGVLIGGLFI